MYIPVLLLFTASATGLMRKECEDCYIVDYNCYNPTLITQLDAPFGNSVVITKLGILHSKNTLYYVFQPKFEDPEYSQIGYLNLDPKKNESGLVVGSKIYNFQTFDVDQENNIVYAGGSSGLYFLDASNKPIFFDVDRNTIVHVLYKGNVYFIKDNENKIIEKRGELFKTYEDYKTVHNFVIDNTNHMVFLNNSGLFLNPLRTKIHKRLSQNRFIRGLAVDLDGVIYAWWINELYKVHLGEGSNVNNASLVKIADIPAIGALTFDNFNNMIYTLGDQLYGLQKVNNSLCEYKEVNE